MYSSIVSLETSWNEEVDSPICTNATIRYAPFALTQYECSQTSKETCNYMCSSSRYFILPLLLPFVVISYIYFPTSRRQISLFIWILIPIFSVFLYWYQMKILKGTSLLVYSLYWWAYWSGNQHSLHSSLSTILPLATQYRKITRQTTIITMK